MGREEPQMADADEHDDPIAQEGRRAREDPERTLLPSNDGLGPGAGETPGATVTADEASAPGDAAGATSTPSLGSPPHKTERPDYRSSQLDGAPEEADA